MEQFIPLLLDVWREACRHIEIEESVTRMAPILARRLPVERVVVRRIDAARGVVQTVAVARCRGEAEPSWGRSAFDSREFTELLERSSAGRMVRCESGEAQGLFPGLMPGEVKGQVMMVPLGREGEPVGVLILVAREPQRFKGEHEAMADALREPFAVALENDRRVEELTQLREALEADKRSLLSRLGRQEISEAIIGSETGLSLVMERVNEVAGADVPVLLLGETGSGKEVVARAIHKRSARGDRPFLRVNCGAIPAELVDSELFGHEKGSFTGATAARKGWFERADGGTLFLDEMGELPAAAQVRLLSIVQDGLFERVGGERQMRVDVRVVAATHRDLQAMVAAGRFREDLWYRIAVFPIRIPPLRERSEDIPALAKHFAIRASKRLGFPVLLPEPHDNKLLLAYDWPGNVRELASVMDRAVILGRGHKLAVGKAIGVEAARVKRREHEEALRATPTPEDKPETLDEAISRHIRAVLARSHGRIQGPDGAAELLGVNPHTLRARMRKMNIDWREYWRPPRARSAGEEG